MSSSNNREQASSAIWVAVSKVDLPEKKYFKIGEVAHLVGVEPHVLRYWQTQFPQVRPHKSRSGHRLYRRKDVETLLAVKELLHVQRFTIAGARQALRSAVVQRGDTTTPPTELIDTEPPRSAEAEGPQTEVDVYGLEAGQLAEAMSHQLAVQSAAAGGTGLAVVEVEGRAEEGDAELDDLQALALVAPRATPGNGAPHVDVSELSPGPDDATAEVARIAVVGDAVPAAPPLGGPAHVVGGAALGEAAPAGAPREGDGDGDVMARARAGGEVGQLGFGFRPTNREALLKARAELAEILGLLDREDARDRRRGLTPSL